MNDGPARTAVRLFDAFWSAGISSPWEIVDQISHLLYLRELDQVQQAWEQGKIPGSEPIFSEEMQHLRWSHLIQMTPQHMYTAVDHEVFPWLRRQAFDSVSYSHHFADARFTIPTPSLLAQAVDLLEKTFTASAAPMTELYERLLDRLDEDSGHGTARTPRHLTELMVAMTAPSPGDVFFDPVCGPGDVLVSAAQFIEQQMSDDPAEGAVAPPGITLSGAEIDARLCRISSLRLALRGFEGAGSRYRTDLLRKGIAEVGGASVVVTTPPLGGRVDFADVAPELLSVARTKQVELLYLAVTIGLLKTQGRAAVLVPQGVLFGSSKAHVELRRLLVENHGLEAVVQLPSGLLRPYAAVQTAILYFTKDAGPSGSVWFYELKADGWSLGSRRMPLLGADKLGLHPDSTLDSADHGRNNLPDLLRRWAQRKGTELRRSRSDQSFCVPGEEIAAEGYELSLHRFRNLRADDKDHLRLGDFAEFFTGWVRMNDRSPEPDPDADTSRRVLTPSALAGGVPDVATLPVRKEEREPHRRLREGDIVGRDVGGSVRHWTLLPAEYNCVQLGQGLIVVRLTTERLPHEYVTAFLSSPLGEERLPVTGTIPRVQTKWMSDIWIPDCHGELSDIRASLALLEAGEREAVRIHSELKRMRMEIFDSGTAMARRERLDEAASISSLTAQNMVRQNEPYRIFQESYPYAIARAVRKYRHALSLAEKHEAVIQCAESLILSLGIMSLAVATDRGRADLPAISQWKQSVARGGVSLGHWVGAFKAVVEDARQHNDPAAGLVEAAARKKGGKGLIADLDQLVALRNKVRHGAGPRTRAEFEKSFERIEKLMFSSLSGCAFLANTRWVHAERLRWLPEAGKFRVSGPSLMGDHPDFSPASFDTAHPLADDRLYLVVPQEQPIPLAPFCLLSDCPTCLAPELYYPDRLTNSTALLKSLDRGHELESDIVHSTIRAWGAP